MAFIVPVIRKNYVLYPPNNNETGIKNNPINVRITGKRLRSNSFNNSLKKNSKSKFLIYSSLLGHLGQIKFKKHFWIKNVHSLSLHLHIFF